MCCKMDEKLEQTLGDQCEKAEPEINRLGNGSVIASWGVGFSNLLIGNMVYESGEKYKNNLLEFMGYTLLVTGMLAIANGIYQLVRK